MKSKSTITPQTLFKPSSMPWRPAAFQKRAVKFLLEHAAAALFLDPGLRKTSAVLAAVKFLISRGLVEKVLIVAPLQVCYSVWPVERDKWTDFNELSIGLLHSKDKDEVLAANAHQIYVINPEGLEWLTQATKTRSPKTGRLSVQVDIRRWKKLGFDTLVVDELTMFKHPQSGRFKMLKHVLHTFGRRWGLTGSPAANHLMDLFGQCYVLDQGRSLGPYITHYQREYFLPGYDGFSWVLKEGADERIYKRIKPLAMRMAAEDYIDLPPVIENHIKILLPDEVMKIYLTLERDLIVRLEAGKVTAATAASSSMKCRQVANGGIYLDQEVVALVKLPKSQREWVDLHEEKTNAIASLVEELQGGSPLLVAYDFEHDRERLLKRLGRDVPYVGGGVSPKRKRELEVLWNAGKLPVLLAHPQTAARGLNLQESGFHIAWHSMTWDYELYDQMIRRLRRSGQKAKHIYVHHLLAAGTIDEVMLGALKGKERGQNALFKALKELRRARK
jgi:SNF2 family DNA or RNA helicase